jgi:hypothetical protein
MDILKRTVRLLSLIALLLLAPAIVKAQGGASYVRYGTTLPACNTSTNNQVFQLTAGTLPSPTPGFYFCRNGFGWVGFTISGGANQCSFWDSTGLFLIGNGRCIDNGTTLSYTGTGGISATSVTTTGGSLSGGLGFGQGPSHTAGTCAGVACIGLQAPVTVSTNGWYTLPPAPTTGVLQSGPVASGIATLSTSGDSSHSTLLPSQIASIATTTVCPATAGGCNSSGMYVISWSIRSSVSCATPGPAGVTLTLGWTDDVGAKTFIVPQTGTGSSGTSVALGNTTNFGHGTLLVNSSGVNPITYSTTYAACTTGTATYNLQLAVFQVD